MKDKEKVEIPKEEKRIISPAFYEKLKKAGYDMRYYIKSKKLTLNNE